MSKPSATREELSDLAGIGAYDEQCGPIALVRYHVWPAYGREAHEPMISCWCNPYVVDFHDPDGHEIWIHRGVA